uniref:Diacylglycerol kinase accessory domain-containing protein n=1 Tax=Photinus pyralis TaxID=7054 RepID=A0A1Y1MDF8_PHOPY
MIYDQTLNFYRWSVEILTHRQLSHLGIRMSKTDIYMYNYISIGVDAQVTLDFHRARSSRFYPFGSRFFNKMLYLGFGTQQVVAADCKNLEQRLNLYLDGVQVDLPELESIVILNIASWGAGVNLWGINKC